MKSRLLALSTNALLARGAPDGGQPVEPLIEAGAEALLIGGRLPRELLEGLALGLARRPELSVLALESPCPMTRESSAELCAPDRAEAEVALEVALAGVRRAAAMEARFAVARLGAVRALEPIWTRTRTQFVRGLLDADGQTQRLAEERRRAATGALDAAKRALEPLLREAERGGVTLLLRNGRRYIDLPSAGELECLLAACAGGPLAPALDVPAAHLQQIMGFEPFEQIWAAFGSAPLVYLADACGPVGGLGPGRGELDLRALAARLPEESAIAFDPWAGLDFAEACAAFSALRRLLRSES